MSSLPFEAAKNHKEILLDPKVIERETGADIHFPREYYGKLQDLGFVDNMRMHFTEPDGIWICRKGHKRPYILKTGEKGPNYCMECGESF